MNVDLCVNTHGGVCVDVREHMYEVCILSDEHPAVSPELMDGKLFLW